MFKTLLEGQSYWLKFFSLLNVKNYEKKFENLNKVMQAWTNLMEDIRKFRQIPKIALNPKVLDATDCLHIWKKYERELV